MLFAEHHTLVPSAVACLLALCLWLSAVRSDDPFLSSSLLVSLQCLVYGNAAALAMTSSPAIPFLNLKTLIITIVYILGTLAIIRQANKVAAIDLEYVKFSFPSKKLGLNIGQRTGQLDQNQVALKLQIFVKEALQFRRLSKIGQLLGICCAEGFLIFVALGSQGFLALLLFLMTALFLAAAIASIASRATLHPGTDSEISISPTEIPRKPLNDASVSQAKVADQDGPFLPNEDETAPEFVPNPFENP